MSAWVFIFFQETLRFGEVFSQHLIVALWVYEAKRIHGTQLGVELSLVLFSPQEVRPALQ